jgi:hypothetical protein
LHGNKRSEALIPGPTVVGPNEESLPAGASTVPRAAPETPGALVIPDLLVTNKGMVNVGVCQLVAVD